MIVASPLNTNGAPPRRVRSNGANAGSKFPSASAKSGAVGSVIPSVKFSFSFVELIRLRERLSQILGRPADLTTREGLHPLLRRDIEAQAIKVF